MVLAVKVLSIQSVYLLVHLPAQLETTFCNYGRNCIMSFRRNYEKPIYSYGHNWNWNYIPNIKLRSQSINAIVIIIIITWYF